MSRFAESLAVWEVCEDRNWYNLLKRTMMKKETQAVEFKQSWNDEYLKWIF